MTVALLTILASVALSSAAAWTIVAAHARGTVPALRHRRGRPRGAAPKSAQLELPAAAGEG